MGRAVDVSRAGNASTCAMVGNIALLSSRSDAGRWIVRRVHERFQAGVTMIGPFRGAASSMEVDRA